MAKLEYEGPRVRSVAMEQQGPREPRAYLDRLVYLAALVMDLQECKDFKGGPVPLDLQETQDPWEIPARRAHQDPLDLELVRVCAQHRMSAPMVTEDVRSCA